MFTLINYEYFDLLTKDLTDKKISIVSDDGLINITNTELHSQQFELTESLCSESELRFGSCEASMVKFTVNNVILPMANKWITVSMVVEGYTDKPLQIGRYKVFSDIATADRTKRDIVAYDAMYDIIGSDMAQWYNTVLSNNDSTVTLKQFRTNFIQHFGLEQENITLVNDDMVVKKTIQITPSNEEDTGTGHKSAIGEALSGRDVLASICEINGCFGHVGRDGKFHWIYLDQDIQGLYPSEDLLPSEDLFPTNPKGTSIGRNKSYIDAQCEKFLTGSITKLQIRQEENDIGKVYPDTPLSVDDNCYIIQGNFLVYGKSSDELNVIAKNLFSKITNIIYRPFNADVIGNPCFEVGDAVRISTKYELVESYILQRTLKGIQALRDAYSANGTERYEEKVNGVHTSIMQIKGKANILTRTIEETKLEMYDIEAGLNNTITITARGLEGKITAETIRAEGEEERLSNSIEITATGLTAEIERATEEEKGIKKDYAAKIKATAEELSSEITEKTQVWKTGDYEISYQGHGEPYIPVELEKYYLDTETGAIYAGVSANPSNDWIKVAGYYKYDKENAIYTGRVLFRDTGEGYGAPFFLKEPLEQYGYVDEDNPPPNHKEGDVWIQPSYSVRAALYFVYSLAHPAEWRIVGYAELETLPEMSSRITQTAKSIELKVSKGDVTSQLLIEPTDIYLKTGRLRIETDNLEINKDGISGEILSRRLRQDGTKQTARYIKLNTGGLEGGYGNTAKCKIQCSDAGLAFRGAIMTFCMDSIYVGVGMDATKTNKAYTGDIAYVAPQDGDVTKLNAAVLHVWNGLMLDNSTYS